MQAHYQLSDSAYQQLIKNGVSIADFLKSIPFFDGTNSGNPITKIGLYYYADTKGNFNAPPTKAKHKLIAKALFEKLETKEKLALLEYIDALESGEF
jgi:hypothetical protein